MRLSLNYIGVLFLVASICRYVFFYDKVEVTRTIGMRCLSLKSHGRIFFILAYVSIAEPILLTYRLDEIIHTLRN